MMLHPEVIWRIGLMCCCSSLGQMCIFLCVIQFGTLTTSIITTLRKFFTILGSVLIFGDAMDTRKKIGAGIVFLGIIVDITAKNRKSVQVEPEKVEMNQLEEIEDHEMSSSESDIEDHPLMKNFNVLSYKFHII